MNTFKYEVHDVTKENKHSLELLVFNHSTTMCQIIVAHIMRTTQRLNHWCSETLHDGRHIVFHVARHVHACNLVGQVEEMNQ